MQHKIDGPWEAVDNSKNALELAMTETTVPSGDRLIAIRDSFDTGTEPVFATRAQVRNLITAYEDGRLSRLLGR